MNTNSSRIPRRRLAVVTGAGSGLGRAIALKLSAAGYDIYALGRDRDRLEGVAREVEVFGSRCDVRSCDVGDWTSVQEALGPLIESGRSIDLVVNNAGGWIAGTVDDSDPRQFEELVRVSILGSFNVTKASSPILGPGASVINIGSTSGLAGSRDNSLSSTPKAAVGLFSETAARELADKGVRVTVINPASVDKVTPYDQVPPPDGEGKFVKLGQGQVADLVVYVASLPPNMSVRSLTVVPTNTKR